MLHKNEMDRPCMAGQVWSMMAVCKCCSCILATSLAEEERSRIAMPGVGSSSRLRVVQEHLKPVAHLNIFISVSSFSWIEDRFEKIDQCSPSFGWFILWIENYVRERWQFDYLFFFLFLFFHPQIQTFLLERFCSQMVCHILTKMAWQFSSLQREVTQFHNHR